MYRTLLCSLALVNPGLCASTCLAAEDRYDLSSAKDAIGLTADRRGLCLVIGSGLERQNDVLALRDGMLILHQMNTDPTTGSGTPPKAARSQLGLEGLIDGTWTRLGTRRSGKLQFGNLLAEMFAWNTSTLVASEALGSCYAIAPNKAASAAKIYPNAADLIWRQVTPRSQVQAMALCAKSVVTAETTAQSPQKATGVLRVLSLDSGKSLAEYALGAQPICKGLAVAEDRVYVSLQNGELVCFGKAP
jgi:hypothetical protein